MTKILIVDDDPIGRKVLRRALIADGVEFVEAANGAEGVDLARREEPDLVLMDVEMPVLNGEEAVRLIRRDELVGDVPIIITSSIADKDRVMKLIKDGINAYVLKPVEASDLRAKANGLLAKRAKTRAASAASGEAASAVLVAHRRPEVRRTVVDAFSPFRYQVGEAETGAGALDLAHKEQAVLAFIELDLPLLDGKEVAGRIRADCGERAPLLVAIADNKETQLDDALRGAGFVEVVDGQVTADTLVQVADRASGERGFLETKIGRNVLLNPVGTPSDVAVLIEKLKARVQEGAATVPTWWLNLAVGEETLACAKEIVAACAGDDVLVNVDLQVIAGTDEAKEQLSGAGLDGARVHARLDDLLARAVA